MKFKNIVFLIGYALFQMGCTSESQPDKEPEIKEKEPLSVILMIGDGMGIPQVSTAFYFGEETPNFKRFETIGLQNTTSVSHKITDSASGATAFSIGEKTYKRAIGVSKDTIPKETILENLRDKGYQTGLVSLTSITHATPASFYAHVKDRDMHEEIAEQLTHANIDFLAGGGRKYFKHRKDGKNLFNELSQNNYHLDTIALNQPEKGKRNAFLISDEGLPSKIEGRDDFLKQASITALNYFDQSEKPFFLMIEGSYIDWAGHAKSSEMAIAEVQDFDETIGAVMDYVETHPNTLLVVTADHETGGMSIGKFYETDEKTGARKEVPEKVSIYFSNDQHSGELIPVFAKGNGAVNFQGIYENNEIYHKIFKAIEEAN